MNLPNKLSITRVLCIPVMTLLMYLSAPWCRWAALGVFAFACFTDYLDGHIARKHQLITDFGKFIDPVADKLLVLSAMIMLVYQQLLPAWAVILVLARELSVDGLRMIAVTKGKVIAAGPAGKLKTTSQMIMIILLMILNIPAESHALTLVLMIWVILITVYSGVDYFSINWRLLTEDKGS